MNVKSRPKENGSRLWFVALKLASLVLSILLLASCEYVSPPIHITYSGVLNGEFDGQGIYYPCLSNMGSPEHPVIWLISFGNAHGVSLYLPIDATPGTYIFQSSGPVNQVYQLSGHIDHTKQGGIYYLFSTSDVASGEITLDTIPTGPNQPIRGHFSATIRSEMYGNDLTIHGEFDFKADAGTSFDCLKP